MLGSYHDAEDVLQETLLAAWQAFDGFEARASLRTWLYKIATNRCLNALRSVRRRSARAWDVAGVVPPEPSRMTEVVWLEPFPGGSAPEPSDNAGAPDVIYERAEAISLAFVNAVQRLPPRQAAALLLCDVIGFRADEVAEMLETTINAVNSAVKRARAQIPQARSPESDHQPPPVASAIESVLVTRFARAWEAADVDGLVDLLTDDVFLSMPPMPFEYEGRDLVLRFCATLFAAGRRSRLVTTRANGQPAFGVYLSGASGQDDGVGLYVLSVSGDRISGMTRFGSTVLPSFGLPTSRP
jgi:RNA polymerase sigma-70 factor (ECF subfamily)